jgi:hypothetical protein
MTDAPMQFMFSLPGFVYDDLVCLGMVLNDFFVKMIEHGATVRIHFFSGPFSAAVQIWICAGKEFFLLKQVCISTNGLDGFTMIHPYGDLQCGLDLIILLPWQSFP